MTRESFGVNDCRKQNACNLARRAALLVLSDPVETEVIESIPIWNKSLCDKHDNYSRFVGFRKIKRSFVLCLIVIYLIINVTYFYMYVLKRIYVMHFYQKPDC